MNLGELTSAEVGTRMASQHGLCFATGPFSLSIRSSIPAVSAAIHRLYKDFPLVADGDYIDFHVDVRPPRSLRRWIRPQVNFYFDGLQPFKPLPLAQAFALLEWGLNWCISNHANQYLIMHAAVVEKGGKAAILPAPPGSGKSTLCAGLVSRGWRLLSDELTLVDRNTGLIQALARPINLKNDSIAVIQAFHPAATFGPVVRDTAKGTVSHLRAPTASVAAVVAPAAAAWVVFPRYVAGSDTVITELDRGYTFLQLAEQSFNYSLLGLEGFQVLGDLIDGCECLGFEYSDLDDAVAFFDELVEEA